MDPRLLEDSEELKEAMRLCPPTTRAKGMARWAADRALQDKHPGQYVAYIDNWIGDELDRVVVANTPDLEEFNRLLKALEPGVRNQMQRTHVPDPNGPLFIGGGELW
ncbi:MAG: hypothetical protein C0467_01615 [Planctomycetaceae bacterium]|nr:hypothetical protein [Planctomycetaceae bacterium]